jgi:putative spermidine/putrescine transport system permease protein
VSGAARPAFLLALPLTLFFLLFFIAPLGVLAVVSLGDATGTSLGVSQYGRIFGDGLSLGVLVDTLLLGVKSTAVCVVFGYPLAWLCATAPPRLRGVLLFIVILPILTSVVVRSFAWIVILGRQGIINHLLLASGLSSQPVALLFTEPGVVAVLAQVQMPLMVLPLLTAMNRIDPNLSDASAALGAGQWRTFRRVILPLSLPGLIAGCILVYAASVTAFVTQTLIGGARLVYMPLFIYQQAISANAWAFAAALSIVFLVSVLLIVTLLNTFARAATARVQA